MARSSRRIRTVVAACAVLVPAIATVTVVWANDSSTVPATYRSMAALGADSAVVLDESGHIEGLGGARSVQSVGDGTTAVDVAGDLSGTGYQVLHVDGAIEARAAFTLVCASAAGSGHAFVALTVRRGGKGAWTLRDDGHVDACGDAPAIEPAAGVPASQRAVGLATSPDGDGYWVVTDRGVVLSAGDAAQDGDGDAGPSTFVAIAAATHGYWLARADGTGVRRRDRARQPRRSGRTGDRPVAHSWR